MKYLLLLLICGGIVCSCTITKRHFGNGYHVEWKRKIRTAPDSSKSSNLESPHTALKSTDDTDSLIIDQTESAEEVVAVPVVIESKAVIEDQNLEEPSFQSEVEIQKSQEIITGQSEVSKETDAEAEEAPKRRMHPLMWGIWGMWSIAIACMFFVTFYAEALIGVGLGFFIAMIFACIVLHALRKHREKYRFKGLMYGFAIPAIVFGAITILGLIIFLLGGVPLGPGA